MSKELQPLFDLSKVNGLSSHLSVINQAAIKGNGLTNVDILSVDQFDLETIDYIFDRAREMRAMVQTIGGVDLLKGRVLACLFYEPSTRTSSSFISAMERLGGSVIPNHLGCELQLGQQGRIIGRHDPHPGAIF